MLCCDSLVKDPLDGLGAGRKRSDRDKCRKHLILLGSWSKRYALNHGLNGRWVLAVQLVILGAFRMITVRASRLIPSDIGQPSFQVHFRESSSLAGQGIFASTADNPTGECVCDNFLVRSVRDVDKKMNVWIYVNPNVHFLINVPDRTNEEIVADALARGIIGSRGKDPLASQGGALTKMYLEGRLPDIRRDESRRPYRYHPKRTENNQLDSKDPPTIQPVIQSITFRPTAEQDQVLTALVSVGAFPTRTEAIQWVLDQGVAAKHDFIQQALDTHQQIEKLRQGLRSSDNGKVPKNE